MDIIFFIFISLFKSLHDGPRVIPDGLTNGCKIKRRGAHHGYMDGLLKQDRYVAAGGRGRGPLWAEGVCVFGGYQLYDAFVKFPFLYLTLADINLLASLKMRLMPSNYMNRFKKI